MDVKNRPMAVGHLPSNLKFRAGNNVASALPLFHMQKQITTTTTKKKNGSHLQESCGSEWLYDRS